MTGEVINVVPPSSACRLLIEFAENLFLQICVLPDAARANAKDMKVESLHYCGQLMADEEEDIVARTDRAMMKTSTNSQDWLCPFRGCRCSRALSCVEAAAARLAGSLRVSTAASTTESRGVGSKKKI
jgi:hypothetical protein